MCKNVPGFDRIDGGEVCVFCTGKIQWMWKIKHAEKMRVVMAWNSLPIWRKKIGLTSDTRKYVLQVYSERARQWGRYWKNKMYFRAIASLNSTFIYLQDVNDHVK